MNLIDISSTSPHYFCGKWIGEQMRIQFLILGFKGLSGDFGGVLRTIWLMCLMKQQTQFMFSNQQAVQLPTISPRPCTHIHCLVKLVGKRSHTNQEMKIICAWLATQQFIMQTWDLLLSLEDLFLKEPESVIAQTNSLHFMLIFKCGLNWLLPQIVAVFHEAVHFTLQCWLETIWSYMVREFSCLEEVTYAAVIVLSLNTPLVR